jgi:hypothetical protein
VHFVPVTAAGLTTLLPRASSAPRFAGENARGELNTAVAERNKVIMVEVYMITCFEIYQANEWICCGMWSNKKTISSLLEEKVYN